MSRSGPPGAPPLAAQGSSTTPCTPVSSPPADTYATLLRDTRGLRREQRLARERWLEELPEPGGREALFELEVLLKGLVCFANPRNHAGLPKRTAVVAQDYRETLTLARDGMQRVIALCRFLSGEGERTFVFQRYLEMLLPDDGARSRLIRGPILQDTPPTSLVLLRQALTNLLEVTNGVARAPRVPFRLFYATLSLAHREVSQSAFFNPLAALEFRPEFDRITNPRILELMRHVQGDKARRLVALTFLSLFRMLHYLKLLDEVVGEPHSAGVVHVILSVLRSDARALTHHLRKQTGPQLALSYERELFKIPASEMSSKYDGMRAEAHRLLGIKAVLGGIAANVRLEVRRSFEHDLPPADAQATHEALRAAIETLRTNLRPALQNGVLALGKALGERLDEHGVFDDAAARRERSVRLRRDVWMFAQIVRAFGAKVRGTPSREERWNGPSSLLFVREFLNYFSAMGYPLLRAADYPRYDAFVAALGAIEETDLLHPAHLEGVLAEVGQFHGFLSQLFEQIGQRDELKGVPFDRRLAVDALKLYLND